MNATIPGLSVIDSEKLVVMTCQMCGFSESRSRINGAWKSEREYYSGSGKVVCANCHLSRSRELIEKMIWDKA